MRTRTRRVLTIASTAVVTAAVEDQGLRRLGKGLAGEGQQDRADQGVVSRELKDAHMVLRLGNFDTTGSTIKTRKCAAFRVSGLSPHEIAYVERMR